jgi:FHA domain/Zn-finger in Ran binding protein and others
MLANRVRQKSSFMKRLSIKHKAKQKDPDLDADSAETLIWTCSACGADNPDSKQTCVSCGGDRAGDSATPKPVEPIVEPAIEPTEEPEPLEAQEPEKTDAEETPAEPTIFSFDTDHAKLETAPEPPEPEITPFLPAPTPYSQVPSTPTIGHGRFYMVFVNTPAASLIKSKVPIEFDDFPVVTIGRGPENVVVIPDQEVSRKHAELTMNGTKLMLKDLDSKNGTFLYNGKEFQQVHDSVEVKPNSIVKFGTGTIVRLTSE